MNIQLFLAGEEVELTQNISFPLNKTFSNLNNPTDIIAEYSKSVNIPMSAKNNRIFANAYRLDKAIVGGGSENLGLYLDPLKRIPMTLMYNGALILKGYAKYVSATYSLSNKYYTINIIGDLGSVFQEMMNIVTRKDLLGDKDEKYLIHNSEVWDGADYATYTVNWSTVLNSWLTEDPKCWDDKRTYNYNLYDVLGFAPSHQGLYSDFDSKKIQTDATSLVEISKILEEKWSTKKPIEQVEKMGASDAVGDGFKDYQMNEFRSYKQKPYIYINQLFKIFSRKCKAITGYEWDLDRSWFNVNNPYWSRLCYMFDYLDKAAPSNKDTVPKKFASSASTKTVTQNKKENKNDKYQNQVTMRTLTFNSTKSYNNGLIISPLKIHFGCKIAKNPTGSNRPEGISSSSVLTRKKIDLLADTQIYFTVRAYDLKTGNIIYTTKYWTNGSGDTSGAVEGFDENNYLTLTGGLATQNGRVYLNDVNYYVTTPKIGIDGSYPNGLELRVTMEYSNMTGYPSATGNKYGVYLWSLSYRQNDTTVDKYMPLNPNAFDGSSNSIEFFVDTEDMYSLHNSKTNTPFTLEYLYKSDEPLFNIILQYTKMFGLHWIVDYINKKISIKSKNGLFRDTSIVDYNDRVDRSQPFIIEPINIQNKYIKFNYDNVDGNIYTGYRETYGSNIGELSINTGYEFNNDYKNLFEGIKPSSASSKSYVTFKQLCDWDTESLIIPKIEKRIMIDCEDKDESKSISLNNWYLRGANIQSEDPILISDDSALMNANNTSCYLSPEYAGIHSLGQITTTFPILSNVVQFDNRILWDDKNTYTSLFNVPNEDYTYNQLMNKVGDYSVYKLFWEKYINEVYNIQNKKVTAYLRIDPIEYERIKFNRFVTIDNQLFMINKVIDYDINTNKSTKVELIQVKDLKNYTNTSFPSLASTTNTIYIKGSSDPNSPFYTTKNYVNVNFSVFGLPIVGIPTISSSLNQYIDSTDAELYSNCRDEIIYFDIPAGTYAEGTITFKNSLEETLTIPVILDYTEFSSTGGGGSTGGTTPGGGDLGNTPSYDPNLPEIDTSYFDFIDNANEAYGIKVNTDTGYISIPIRYNEGLTITTRINSVRADVPLDDPWIVVEEVGIENINGMKYLKYWYNMRQDSATKAIFNISYKDEKSDWKEATIELLYTTS